MEITKDKITEIFCIIDEFCQEYDKEIARMSICEPDGRKHRNRKWTMSRSEIMTILICFHFNTFRNFKHYYLFYVKMHLCDLFPKQLSYNRFVELESRVSVGMIVTSNITSTLKDAFRLATEKMPECARLIPLFPEIKSTTMPYDALDSQEALKLKKVIDNMGDNWSMRDKAITSIVYYLGLRRGDIARLRIQDVDFESDSLSFIQSKTLVRQELSLRPVVGNAIYNYIVKERPSCDIESLFVIDDGKNIRPMTAWCVYDIMKKVFKAADVRTDGGLKGVHIFRHNLASKLMHLGCDSLEVTAVLGHIRPESLKSYLFSDEKALKKCALDINEYPINMTAFNQYL